MRAAVTIAMAMLMACLAAGSVSAAPEDVWLKSAPFCASDGPVRNPWAVEFGTAAPQDETAPAPAPLWLQVAAEQPVRRPVPFEYSDGYRTRAKIHRIASYATLPLFVANYFVGQSLYDNPGDHSKLGAHDALIAGTAVVFGVNTFTGVWNLWEGRKDPTHRAKRMTHGILMMIADVGFLATAALAPDDDEGEHAQIHNGTASPSDGRSTHRAVALTSMGIATVSYLIMLFGGK